MRNNFTSGIGGTSQKYLMEPQGSGEHTSINAALYAQWSAINSVELRSRTHMTS